MRSTRRWFYLLVGAQALFLLGWSGFLEAELARSPTVLLEVRPVDPSEIIRGTYIRLGYTISDVPNGLLPHPQGMQYGDPVCVELESRERFWEVAAASAGPCAGGESPGASRLRVEGRIESWNDDSVALDYGIDRFYVPEGKGTPRGELTVRAAITSWHRALIKEVYLDGKPYP